MNGKPEVLLVTPFYQPSVDELKRRYHVHEYWLAPDRERLLGTVSASCRAIATSGVAGGDVIEGLENLGIIASFGVGYDGVDVALASERQVKVTNTPDVLTDEVADLGIGLLIATARRIVEADRFVREGAWLEGPMHFNQSLTGKRLGILGMGRIGLAVARRAEACRVEVAYHNRRQRDDVPYRYFESPVALARESDFLMVCTPGGSGTQALVDADVMTALGGEGILINIARGSVVDEDALVAALLENRLGAAGLDVFADEPNVPKALLEMTDRVVLQPHQASATHETRAAMGQLVLDNLDAFFAGKPLLTPVN